MGKVLADEVASGEALPHKKAAAKKSGKKTACPANEEGNGAHVYAVMRYEVEQAGYNGQPHTFHSKICVGCGKRLYQRGLWHYQGEVFQTKRYANMMEYLNDPEVRG